MGHFLGLPDLYDTDNNGRGVGNWDLMGSSWGWDRSQNMPSHLSAWSRIQLGYATVVEVTATGVYTAPAAETSPTVYRISAGFPAGEYLLIENRQRLAFDQGIPANGAGIVIYHIDEAATDSTQSCPMCTMGSWPQDHYRVSVVQADGSYHLERNVNSGGMSRA
jgi:hypothetical protein